VKIEWISNGGSSLPDHVKNHLPESVRVDCRLWDRGGKQHCVMTTEAADLLVLEHPPIQPVQATSWLAPGRIRNNRFVLVLLPMPCPDQTGQWLDAGADRCIIAEDCRLVLAMVKATLRRSQGLAATVSVLGPLRFEHDARSLFHESQRIALTSRETQVAALLFQKSPNPIKSSEILAVLGHDDCFGQNSGIASLYVHRINRKIRPYGVQITFTRGYGYRLTLKSDSGVTERHPIWSNPWTLPKGWREDSRT